MVVNPGLPAQSFLAKAGKLAALICFGVFAGLALLEIIVRTIEPRATNVYVPFKDDPILNHSFFPNIQGKLARTDFDTDFHTNSLGLRDREYSIPKPSGTFRILMLGDSFTAGEGVNIEETFSKRLETTLSNIPAKNRFEVINAGVGGYSPLLEFLYLRHYGLQLQPDLVVLNMDISDVFDDFQYSQLLRVDSNGVPLAAPYAGSVEQRSEEGSPLNRMFVSVKDFIKENTKLYNFVRFRVYLQNEQRKREGIRSGDLRYDKLAQLRNNFINRGESDWAQTLKYLLLIRDTLRQRNIDFLMTVYPYGLQVSKDEWKAGRKYWGFVGDTVYSTWPQDYIEQFCKRSNIEVINMCDDFKEGSTKEVPLYFDFDGHWTSAGHELAATIICRKLEPYLHRKGVLQEAGQ